MKTKKKKNEIPPIHPGEILLEDFMKPLGLSQYRVAKAISVPPRRINEIVQGKRAVTAETALRLERYLGWPAQVWLNLQSRYEMEITAPKMSGVLSAIASAVAEVGGQQSARRARRPSSSTRPLRRKLVQAA